MTFPRFKLYHYPLSRSVRVKWALHEILNEDFDVERVALMQGAHHSPEFSKINPNHAVPVLNIETGQDQSFSMIESAAMLVWLGDEYAKMGFAPAITDTRARADYLQMIHFGGSWMDMMLWQIRMHQDLLPKGVADPKSIDFNTAKFKNEVEPQLKSRLNTHPFICGHTFSFADIMIGYNVGWARAYRLCSDEVFSQYRSRLAQRPAFVQSYADAEDFGK